MNVAGPMSIGGAARVDGRGWFRIHRLIVMPLLGPLIARVAIRTFIPVRNAHLWPFIVTRCEAVPPMMVGARYFFQLDVGLGENMAYLSMIPLPALALFLAFQRSFIENIAASGAKG